jgi:hypothetical protein
MVTVKDIATAVGVSVATVSNVLNDRPNSVRSSTSNSSSVIRSSATQPGLQPLEHRIPHLGGTQASTDIPSARALLQGELHRYPQAVGQVGTA